jgi:hypothetical protein
MSGNDTGKKGKEGNSKSPFSILVGCDSLRLPFFPPGKTGNTGS